VREASNRAGEKRAVKVSRFSEEQIIGVLRELERLATELALPQIVVSVQ